MGTQVGKRLTLVCLGKWPLNASTGSKSFFVSQLFHACVESTEELIIQIRRWDCDACGVATNRENLEYLGISLNMENSWNCQGILCNLREN